MYALWSTDEEKFSMVEGKLLAQPGSAARCLKSQSTLLVDSLTRSTSIRQSGYAEGLGKCFAGQSSLDGRSITLSTLT